MGLLFVPLYIKYLGLEAYGLIGLFAVLQAGLNLLDMGMTPTLNREMARFTAGENGASAIRDLLRSIEIITFLIACFIATSIWFASDWLANEWLSRDRLPLGDVASALAIMGGVSALRFTETIYRSSIIGLQRQVLFNRIIAIVATIRGVGAVAVLAWLSSTINAYFIWQGVVSVLSIIILAFFTYRNLPIINRVAKFSVEALRSVWRFAWGLMGITILALLLTQIDKILLSNLLLLTEYGYYTLAGVVAGALYPLIKPISQAWYPRLCELYSRNDEIGIAETFHRGAQLVSVIAGSAAIIVITFSDSLLYLWTQNTEIVQHASLVTSLLMIGNLLNGLMWIPYQAQLAYGWTGLALRINIVSVLIVIPALLWITPRFGAEGAACVWIALNAGYVLVGIHFMYKRILVAEKWQWYFEDVAIPMLCATFIALSVKWIFPETTSMPVIAFELLLASIVVLLTAIISATHVRRMFFDFMKTFINQYAVKFL